MSAPPANWATISIHDALQPQADSKLIHQGWSPRCENEPAKVDSEWAVLKTTSIQDGVFLSEHNKRLPVSLAPKERLEVMPGDLLLTCAGPRIRCGVTALVRHTRPRLMISGKMYRFRANPEVIAPRFLEAYLRTPTTRALIDGMKTGISESGMNITHDKFAELTIPLAPLAEQERIADKLDAILARVDACRERLNRLPLVINRFRQAVLAAATSGRLTADWRDERMGSAGTEDRTPGDVNHYWAEKKLVDLCQDGRVITYGVIKLGDEVPDGIPCLRTSNVRWLRIDTDGIKRIAASLSAEYARTVLQGTEILVNVRGTLGGVVGVTPEMKGWNVSREVAVVPVDATKVVTNYLTLWLASDSSQRWLGKATKGVAYVGINIEDLRNLPVKLPLPNEQQEIIRRVETLFDFADRLEARLATASSAADRLTPALLSKAFRGELVPQDPNDEPATELLKRIVARGAGDGPRRGRTTKV